MSTFIDLTSSSTPWSAAYQANHSSVIKLELTMPVPSILSMAMSAYQLLWKHMFASSSHFLSKLCTWSLLLIWWQMPSLHLSGDTFHVIWSNNGSSFVGASQEITELMDFLKPKEKCVISEFCFVQNLEWRFISEHAPHFGGLYLFLSLVIIVQWPLYKVVERRYLYYVETCPLPKWDPPQRGFPYQLNIICNSN